MRSLKNIVSVLGGVVGLSAVASALAIGCGGDDTLATIPDAGLDQTASDVSSDTTPPPPDMGLDGGPEVDSSPDSDSSPPGDAASDVDPAVALASWPSDVAVAICGRLSVCCFPGNPSTWDSAHCTQLFSNGTGWQGSLAGLQVPGILDGGNLKYNVAPAADCLARLRTFTCPNIGAPEFKAMSTQCYAGVTGTIPTSGTGCRVPIECAPGNYCQAAAADSGVDGGTCVALRQTGAACSDVASSAACSYRSSGEICDRSVDGSACTALVADGLSCFVNSQCVSGLCDTGVCVTSKPITFPAFCDIFKIQDAGDGG